MRAGWLAALLHALTLLLAGHTAQLLAEVGDGTAVDAKLLHLLLALRYCAAVPPLRERGRDLRVD
jgi:hypothetical protein